MPITVCMIRKSLKDDETLKELQHLLKYYKQFGSMSIFKCTRHKPPCKMLDEEEMLTLNKRLMDIDPDRKKFPKA